MAGKLGLSGLSAGGPAVVSGCALRVQARTRCAIESAVVVALRHRAPLATPMSPRSWASTRDFNEGFERLPSYLSWDGCVCTWDCWVHLRVQT